MVWAQYSQVGGFVGSTFIFGGNVVDVNDNIKAADDTLLRIISKGNTAGASLVFAVPVIWVAFTYHVNRAIRTTASIGTKFGFVNSAWLYFELASTLQACLVNTWLRFASLGYCAACAISCACSRAVVRSTVSKFCYSLLELFSANRTNQIDVLSLFVFGWFSPSVIVITRLTAESPARISGVIKFFTAVNTSSKHMGLHDYLYCREYLNSITHVLYASNNPLRVYFSG